MLSAIVAFNVFAIFHYYLNNIGIGSLKYTIAIFQLKLQLCPLPSLG